MLFSESAGELFRDVSLLQSKDRMELSTEKLSSGDGNFESPYPDEKMLIDGIMPPVVFEAKGGLSIMRRTITAVPEKRAIISRITSIISNEGFLG